MRKISSHLIFALLYLCVSANAQNWTGVLDPSRAIDWSGSGVVGGIPARTTICTTLGTAGQLPTFVQSVTSAQINSAIAACGSGNTVFLNAGTYNLTHAITFQGTNNVTLRGAGADQTIINGNHTDGNGNASCGLYANICIWSGDYSDKDHVENSANWTGTTEGGPGVYPVGATHITLSSTSNLAAGNFILLDQLDDSSDGFPIAGGIFVCSTNTCTGQSGGASSRTGRGQLQMARVTAINGTTVTISPGLTMPNWRSSQTPQAWWPNSVIKGDGIENLTANSPSGNQCSTCGNITLFNSIDSWVKGVRSISPNTNGGQPVASHVWLDMDLNATVQDSYFYGSDNSSQSYGVEFFVTQFDVVQNNIFQHVTAPTVNNGPSNGNVIGYNFAIDDNYTAAGNAPSWMDPMNTWHEVGQAMDLYEGNSGLGFQADNIHGTHQFGTYFRNYYYGDLWNNPVKNGNTELMHLWRYNRFFNIIGNVLGRVGYYDNYQTGNATSIFNLLGDPDPASPGGTPADPFTTSTAMRWGNYDTVTGTSRFVSSEVPSGIPNFSNPVPANNNLPASFYLTSKPAWIGASPWPLIGPDVSGGDQPGVAGHANRIPAETCWYSVMNGVVGSSGLLTFNADTCYASNGNPPAPPTSLNAQVQ